MSKVSSFLVVKVLGFVVVSSPNVVGWDKALYECDWAVLAKGVPGERVPRVPARGVYAIG